MTHRALGYAFLALWTFVVCPTSAYLSLQIQGDTIWGTLAVVTLLDVTFLSAYTFYRGWRLARRRRRGEHSLTLHGNLMGLGLLGTMSQIPQRLILLARALPGHPPPRGGGHPTEAPNARPRINQKLLHFVDARGIS